MAKSRENATGIIASLMIHIIKAYKLIISPFIGSNCRFYPTCSCYAIESIIAYGALTGGRLALLRLLRCQPFHSGGYDPVPASSADTTNDTNNNRTGHNMNNQKSIINQKQIALTE